MTAPLRSVPAGAVTLEDAIPAYLGTLSHPESAGTRKAYATTLWRLARDLGLGTDVAAITQADLAAWMHRCHDANAPKTWNRARGVLRAAWAYWADCGWARKRGGPRWPVEARKEPEPRARAIPGTVMAALLGDEDIPVRERALWWMLYETGARASEILRLDIEDLSTDLRRAPVVRKGGKHDEVLWSAMTAALLPVLLDGRTQGPVFLSSRGRLSYRRAAGEFTIRTAALAGGPYTLHQLRHRQMTDKGEAGMSTEMMKVKSGHRSGKSLAIYVRPSLDALAAWEEKQGPPPWWNGGNSISSNNPEGSTEMTSTELPAWAGYTVSAGHEYAAYLEQSGTALGLRIMDLGDGRAALDANAVENLMRQPENADGVISQDEGGLRIWLQGTPYPVRKTVLATAAITAINQETVEAGRVVSHDTITVWDESGDEVNTIFVESSQAEEAYITALRDAGYFFAGTTAARQHVHGGEGWVLAPTAELAAETVRRRRQDAIDNLIATRGMSVTSFTAWLDEHPEAEGA